MYTIREIKNHKGELRYWVFCKDIYGNAYDTMYDFKTYELAKLYINRQIELFAQ